MPVPTRTIQGKVLIPSGAGAVGGLLVITLSREGKVSDGVTNHKAAGMVKIAVGTDGTVAFALIPNDAITPAGTFYQVAGRLPDGFAWRDSWDIPSGGTPLDIGAIPSIAGLPIDPRIFEVPAVTVLPTASSEWQGRVLRVNPTDGSPSYLAVCLPNGAGVYRWDIFATGGG